MIKIYNFEKDNCDKVLNRTQLNFSDVEESVRAILKDVKLNGDEAIKEYSKKFDNFDGDLVVTEEEIDNAYNAVSAELLASLRRAKDNILSYHTRQLRGDSLFCENGKTIGYVVRAVETAGIYVPGGLAAYPSSVLMCALPAKAAGVENIVMVSPFKNGVCNPLTLVAARECGVKTIYKVGGAQAIAALGYGTKTIKKADVIVGPGNIYVTIAKKEVFGNVGIDMIAGPSEILIVADGSVPASFAAADLLSQAEHDRLAASIMVTTSESYARQVQEQVNIKIERLPKADIAEESILSNGGIIVCKDMDTCIMLANKIAPEHLELLVSNADELLPEIKNAGAVFMGAYSPEPLGDYFAGPNHVLPTSGTARYFSALSSDNFVKKISVVKYDKENLLNAAADIIAIAECEGLTAHANSIRVRSEIK